MGGKISLQSSSPGWCCMSREKEIKYDETMGSLKVQTRNYQSVPDLQVYARDSKILTVSLSHDDLLK